MRNRSNLIYADCDCLNQTQICVDTVDGISVGWIANGRPACTEFCIIHDDVASGFSSNLSGPYRTAPKPLGTYRTASMFFLLRHRAPSIPFLLPHRVRTLFSNIWFISTVPSTLSGLFVLAKIWKTKFLHQTVSARKKKILYG